MGANDGSGRCVGVERPTEEALRARIAELEGDRVLLDSWGIDLVAKMGELVRKAATGGPLTTCIECRAGEDGEGIPVVYLWATPHDQEPVARIRELAAEKERYRQLAGAALASSPTGRVVVEVDRLREIEWVPDYDLMEPEGGGPMTMVQTESICLVCGRAESNGHAADCWLAAILEGADG